MIKSLKSKSLDGLKWTTIEYILLFSMQIIQLSVLARLLTPADFGIFAIGTFFTSLGNSVFALGFGPALIQKQGKIDNYLNTAWTSNLLISLFASLLLALLSPSIATTIFKNDEAILPAIIMISVVLISGFNNIATVKYYKEIQLKRIFLFNIVPKVFSITIILGLAFILKSYWALVIGMVTEYIIKCITSYVIYPYKPHFELNRNKFKELYSFGGWLQLKNIINWLAGYIDVAFVGNILSTEVLGFYNRAQTMAKIPQTQINRVVNTISFPLYSKVINDRNKLQKALDATNDLVLVIIFPVIAITLLFGKQIIYIVLGEQWLYLENTFKILILAFSMQSFVYSFYPLLRAFGYPKLEFVFQTVKILLLVTLIYPLTKYYGILGTGIAIFTSVALVVPFMLYKILRVTKLDFKRIYQSTLICILGVIITYPLIYIFRNFQLSIIHTALGISLLLTVFFAYIFITFYFTKLGPAKSIITALQSVLKEYNKSIK